MWHYVTISIIIIIIIIIIVIIMCKVIFMFEDCFHFLCELSSGIVQQNETRDMS